MRCRPLTKLNLILLALAVGQASSPFARQPAVQKPGGAPPSARQAAASQEIASFQKQSRSHLRLDRLNNPIDLYLFAADEQVEVLEGSYCGGDQGAKQYSGHYQLVSVVDNAVVSRLDLDPEVSFVENKLHDGVRLHRDTKTGHDLVVLFQYGTCNSESVQFFSADPSGRLHPVPFLDKDGRTWSHQVTGPAGTIPRLPDGSSVFCAYANNLGYDFCEAYAFDGANFQETAKWMTRELDDPVKGLNPPSQAMRALYDFLVSLSARNCSAAAYYFLGYSAPAGAPPAMTSPAEKAKMLEAYCTRQGGQCLMPLKIEGNGRLDAQGAMPFTVSFQTSDFDPLQINGRTSFEFRMWRTAEGFKVLDLPPRPP
jgi:hypothetical protein